VTVDGRTTTVTAIGIETVVLARRDLPNPATGADRDRNNVGAALHNDTTHRDDMTGTADHPNPPRHPPCRLKLHFNLKTRVSPE
jgi:hypothetical protein